MKKIVAIAADRKSSLLVGPICIFLTPDDVACVSMCLLAICVPSLEERLSKSFVCFLIGTCFRFPVPAVTNYHKSGGVSNRNRFSHGPEAWKSEIKIVMLEGSRKEPVLCLFLSPWLLSQSRFLAYRSIPGVCLCCHVKLSFPACLSPCPFPSLPCPE